MDKEVKYIALQPASFDSCKDEINLKELLFTIKKNIKILYITTFLATSIAIIYTYFIAKPLYKITSNLNSGYIISKTQETFQKRYLIDPYEEKIYIKNIYDKSKSQESLPKVDVDLEKNNKSILKISIYDRSNEKALKILYRILKDINSKESKKISDYKKVINNEINIINNQISSLKNYINSLQKDYNSSTNPDFKISLLKVINLTQKTILDYELKIANLKYQISENNLVTTKIIGTIKKQETPIKPQKKLIIIITFITALLFSIFLIFFIEFIKTLKEDDSNNKK